MEASRVTNPGLGIYPPSFSIRKLEVVMIVMLIVMMVMIMVASVYLHTYTGPQKSRK